MDLNDHLKKDVNGVFLPTNMFCFWGPPEKKTLCQKSAWMLGTWPTLATRALKNKHGAIGVKSVSGGNVVLDEASRHGENI